MNPILQDTDTQLAGMTPLQRGIVIATIALLIPLAGWYFLIDGTMEEIDAAKERVAKLERKIAHNRIAALKRAVAKLKKENLRLQRRIEHYRAMERLVQSRAERLDIFLFDPARYMAIFEKILKRSVDLGIRIDDAYSQRVEGEISPLIDRWQRLVIEGSGDFGAVTRLSRYIESFKALAKISHYRYWYDEKAKEPRFEITILFYGASR